LERRSACPKAPSYTGQQEHKRYGSMPVEFKSIIPGLKRYKTVLIKWLHMLFLSNVYSEDSNKEDSYNPNRMTDGT
jgi:hypothetical protein